MDNLLYFQLPESRQAEYIRSVTAEFSELPGFPDSNIITDEMSNHRILSL